jgi:hypothetical protein
MLLWVMQLKVDTGIEAFTSHQVNCNVLLISVLGL